MVLKGQQNRNYNQLRQFRSLYALIHNANAAKRSDKIDPKDVAELPEDTKEEKPKSKLKDFVSWMKQRGYQNPLEKQN